MGRITRTMCGCVETKVFTNAEMLQFPVLGSVEIIPEIPDHLIFVWSAIASLVWAADLTNIDDNTDEITLGYTTIGSGTMGAIAKNSIFEAGASSVAGQGVVGTGVLQVLSPVETQLAVSGISLFFQNGSAGAFTGGALGNRFIVQLSYNAIAI